MSFYLLHIFGPKDTHGYYLFLNILRPYMGFLISCCYFTKTLHYRYEIIYCNGYNNSNIGIYILPRRCFEERSKHKLWIIIHLPNRFLNTPTNIMSHFWDSTIPLQLSNGWYVTYLSICGLYDCNPITFPWWIQYGFR